MPPLTLEQIVLIVLGVAVIIAGLVLLGRRPSGSPDEPAEDPQDGSPRDLADSPSRGLSEPTRLTIVVVTLVVGYHLLMWGLPPRWASAASVPRHNWHYVAAGAAIALVASLLLDLTSRRQPPR